MAVCVNSSHDGALSEKKASGPDLESDDGLCPVSLPSMSDSMDPAECALPRRAAWLRLVGTGGLGAPRDFLKSMVYTAKCSTTSHFAPDVMSHKIIAGRAHRQYRQHAGTRTRVNSPGAETLHQFNMDGYLPLRVTGSLKGVVFARSLDQRVLELRSEVARLLGEKGSALRTAGYGFELRVDKGVTCVRLPVPAWMSACGLSLLHSNQGSDHMV